MSASVDLALAPLHDALRSAAQRSVHGRYQQHLFAVLLVAQGQTCGQVGQWLACSPRSIERWVKAYRAGGCSALLVLQGTGRPAQLTAQQMVQLRSELALPPETQGFPQAGWCGKLLVTHVMGRYGAELSVRQCQRLLAECRDQPVPAKPAT